MVLPQYQIDANKRFFLDLISILEENGVWIWPGTMESFQLKNGKFEGSREAIDKVRRITDDVFIGRYFVVKE